MEWGMYPLAHLGVWSFCDFQGASQHKVLRVGGTVGYACPEYLRNLARKILLFSCVQHKGAVYGALPY